MAWEEPRKTGMLYRRVGKSGLHVSVLGLGGWLTYVYLPHNHHTAFINETLLICLHSRFGGHVENGECICGSGFNTGVQLTNLQTKERTFECMKQAYDCGINFFDTAERCNTLSLRTRM